MAGSRRYTLVQIFGWSEDRACALTIIVFIILITQSLREARRLNYIYIVGTLETGNAMSEDTESETIRVNELGQGQEWLRGGLSVGSCAIG